MTTHRSTVALTLVSALCASSRAQSDPVLDANNPDKFTWEVFAQISQDANDGTRNVIWETLATPEDLFSDPNDPPEWPGAGTRNARRIVDER